MNKFIKIFFEKIAGQAHPPHVMPANAGISLISRRLRVKPAMTLVLLLCATISCNRDEVFEREQYKHVFALVSGTDNISVWEHDLRMPESVGFVTISMGGSNPTDRDATVTLAEAPRLIDAYNLVAFDLNTSRYLQPLASRRYTIDSYQMTIPAGEPKAYIPVRIRPQGLSPDSAYLIALKVDTYNTFEVNPEKDFVLYQVQTKNWWATYRGSVYSQRGTMEEAGTDGETQVFGTKRLFPLTETSVRALAGDELNDNADLAIFRRYSMILNIGNDNKVQIEPYGSLQITQIDNDAIFGNIVMLENDGFRTYKTFLLHYQYTASDGKTYNVKEELRLDYREDPEDPRFLVVSH